MLPSAKHSPKMAQRRSSTTDNRSHRVIPRPSPNGYGIFAEDVRDLVTATVEHRFGRVNRLPSTIE